MCCAYFEHEVNITNTETSEVEEPQKLVKTVTTKNDDGTESKQEITEEWVEMVEKPIETVEHKMVSGPGLCIAKHLDGRKMKLPPYDDFIDVKIQYKCSAYYYAKILYPTFIVVAIVFNVL